MTSTARLSATGPARARSSIPRNPAVLADVDDINTQVGFWAPQPEFRIPERLSPGYEPFPDLELEEIYEDLVRTFTDYQARVALRAISRVPDADLAMIYFEQPDGSSHQFLLTDPRQPTDFKNPASIGAGQDKAKVARYASYVRTAYQVANRAVQRIIEAVGTDGRGRPQSNVIVVSDHGFEIFHTAVNMNAFLAAQGFDPAKVRAVTSGPAVNVYINLQGREPNGVVSRAEYVILQTQLAVALESLTDTNAIYTLGKPAVPVFDKVYTRPVPADLTDPFFGRGGNKIIGQDSGDVFALLTPGYNFDGVQSPVVARLGDPAAATSILSLPNFYGAQGYDPALRNLSAIFLAAGPDIRHGELTRVSNIDIAPTIARLLGVAPATTVDGGALPVRVPHRVQIALVERLASCAPPATRRPRGRSTRPSTICARGSPTGSGKTACISADAASRCSRKAAARWRSSPGSMRRCPRSPTSGGRSWRSAKSWPRSRSTRRSGGGRTRIASSGRARPWPPARRPSPRGSPGGRWITTSARAPSPSRWRSAERAARPAVHPRIHRLGEMGRRSR